MTISTCKAQDPSNCRFHGTGVYKEPELLVKDEFISQMTNAMQETIADVLIDHPKEEAVSMPKPVLSSPEPAVARVRGKYTEASSITPIMDREPEYDEIEGVSKSIECVCGKTRYGVDYKCNCGARTADISGYRVKEEDRELIENKKAVKSRYWYHSTTKEGWAELMKSEGVPVHLGNEQASFERAVDNNAAGSSSSEYYLYKVKLKTFSRVADNVCPDLNNEWSESMEDLKGKIGNKDFVRYVNSYEDGGSVSLYGSPSKFKVVEVSKARAM